jgi:hypothetical protein
MRKSNIVAFVTVLSLLLIVNTSVKAQSGSLNRDSSAKVLATKLSVSPERAKRIQDAYGAYRQDIEKIMKDTQMKPAEKQRQLRRYQGLRRHMIDSLVSKQEQASLGAGQQGYLQQEAEHRKKLEARHEQELNKVPHKRVSAPIKKVTIANRH